jgi:hypothetical protein
MPIRIDIDIKGIEEAIGKISTLMSKVEDGVIEGLLIGAEETKNQLNTIPEYQGQAEIFVYSPKKIFVGPSITLVEAIERMPEWTKYKGRKKCPWWFYITYVLPEERLPIVGTAREEVEKIAYDMRIRIREIIKRKIIEKLGV